MSRAPSIAVARFRVRRATTQAGRNAAEARLMAHTGIVPIAGSYMRVAWERESGREGFDNRRMRRHRAASALAVVMAVALGACSPRAWKIADVSTMVASEATLVCDWRQTHHAAENNWRGTWEGNAMLGRAPSTTAVDFYFIGAALALAAVRFLPERIQPFIYGAATTAEAVTIAGNVPQIGSCL